MDDLYEGHCVAGCQSFHGGEKRHHKDCGHYPDSLTKLNDDRIEAITAETERLQARVAELEKLGPILDILPDAVEAAEKAMQKYPQPNYVITKWAEETGEVTKDLIHVTEGRQSVLNLRGEIVQSLAMLHRLLVEGDGVHGLPPVANAIRALMEKEQGE